MLLRKFSDRSVITGFVDAQLIANPTDAEAHHFAKFAGTGYQVENCAPGREQPGFIVSNDIFNGQSMVGLGFGCFYARIHGDVKVLWISERKGNL